MSGPVNGSPACTGRLDPGRPGFVQGCVILILGAGDGLRIVKKDGAIEWRGNDYLNPALVAHEGREVRIFGGRTRGEYAVLVCTGWGRAICVAVREDRPSSMHNAFSEGRPATEKLQAAVRGREA